MFIDMPRIFYIIIAVGLTATLAIIGTMMLFASKRLAQHAVPSNAMQNVSVKARRKEVSIKRSTPVVGSSRTTYSTQVSTKGSATQSSSSPSSGNGTGPIKTGQTSSTGTNMSVRTGRCLGSLYNVSGVKICVSEMRQANSLNITIRGLRSVSNRTLSIFEHLIASIGLGLDFNIYSKVLELYLHISLLDNRYLKHIYLTSINLTKPEDRSLSIYVSKMGNTVKISVLIHKELHRMSITTLMYQPMPLNLYCVKSPYGDVGICFRHVYDGVFNIYLLSQSTHVKFCIGPGVRETMLPPGIYLCLYTGLGIGDWDTYWRCWTLRKILTVSLYRVLPCEWRYIYAIEVELHGFKAHVRYLYTMITGYLEAVTTTSTERLYSDICRIYVRGILHVEKGVNIKLNDVPLYYKCSFGIFRKGIKLKGRVTLISVPSNTINLTLIAFYYCHYITEQGITIRYLS